jgi:hypothetical protein
MNNKKKKKKNKKKVKLMRGKNGQINTQVNCNIKYKLPRVTQTNKCII